MSNLISGGRVRIQKHQDRALLDTYSTPVCAVDCLLDHHSLSHGSVWEPAAGDGYIVKRLLHYGITAQATDIKTGVDFLVLRGVPLRNHIVTNPPFCLAEEFILQGIALCTDSLSLLLRVAYMASESRYRLFQLVPPSKVVVLARRLPYQDSLGNWYKSGGQFDHAWYIWDKNRPSTQEHTQLVWALPKTENIHP